MKSLELLGKLAKLIGSHHPVKLGCLDTYSICFVSFAIPEGWVLAGRDASEPTPKAPCPAMEQRGSPRSWAVRPVPLPCSWDPGRAPLSCHSNKAVGVGELELLFRRQHGLSPRLPHLYRTPGGDGHGRMVCPGERKRQVMGKNLS